MKIIIMFILIFYSSLFALQDLGQYGKTYSIKEKNFLDIVKKRLSVKKIEKFKSNMISSYKRLMSPHLGMQLCLSTEKRIYTPFYVLKNNIVLPNGKVLYKKGYKFNILKRMKQQGGSFSRYILFIDASSPIQVKLASKYADVADIIVTDGDMIKLYKKYQHVYIANKTLIKAFNVQCVPSFYVQKGNHFEISEYREKYLQRILK